MLPTICPALLIAFASVRIDPASLGKRNAFKSRGPLVGSQRVARSRGIGPFTEAGSNNHSSVVYS